MLTPAFIIILLINLYIPWYTCDYIKHDPGEFQPCQTALIPGARVYRDGSLSPILYDRVVRALKLYRKKKVKKLLLSGDHGTRYYDEVNNMKKFLLRKGVQGKDIFMDHAGFNTYDSIIRAKKVFQVKSIIIVTQSYHLPRAVYIAKKAGLRAFGYPADRRTYLYIRQYKLREVLARVKSFLEVTLNLKPRFLGPVIPITGSGKKSWD